MLPVRLNHCPHLLHSKNAIIIGPVFMIFCKRARYFLHLRRLEKYFAKISLGDLYDLSLVILSSFMCDISRSLGKWGMRELCCVLRVFLRYLYQERIVTRDLSPTIEPPLIYRLSDIPRSISWGEVSLLLEAVDRRTPTGKRDCPSCFSLFYR
jgi:integrase/recombinase XerD